MSKLIPTRGCWKDVVQTHLPQIWQKVQTLKKNFFFGRADNFSALIRRKIIILPTNKPISISMSLMYLSGIYKNTHTALQMTCQCFLFGNILTDRYQLRLWTYCTKENVLHLSETITLWQIKQAKWTSREGRKSSETILTRTSI